MKELFSQIASLTGTLSQVAKDRLKNPILSSFLFSWIIWNWRPVSLFLLSDSSIENRINVITQNYNNIHYLLWYPLLSALFLYVVMPYLSICIELVLNYARNYNRNQQTKQKINVLRGQLKYENEEKKLRDISLDNRQIENLEKEISLREQELADERKKSKDLLKEIESKNNHLTELNKNYSINEKKLANNINEKNKENQILKNKIVDVQKQLNTKNNSLKINSTKESEYHTPKIKASSIDGYVKTLRQEIDELNSQIIELKSENKNHPYSDKN